MDRSDRLYGYRFSDVYGLYLSKVSRKGRSREELDRVIFWLTGYDEAALERRSRAAPICAPLRRMPATPAP